ncbi:MAG: amidohydrolase [Lentisphaeria bacterium]|nr:amidohydrolase [Lentisphaeria bacterium]
MTKYRIIDAHIHPFTPECGKNIARFGHPQNVEELFGELKSLGISRCCGTFIVSAESLDFADVMKLNEAALALREKYPDFYVPGIHIHGGYPEESCRMLRNFHREGVRWIGELVNYSMPVGAYDSCGMMEIYETVSELGMVLNLHVNTPELAALEAAAKKFPRMNIVLAHPGDGDLKQRLALVKKYPNLHFDVSGTGLFRWGLLRHLVDELGAERVLFGSDFPVCSPGMNLHGALSEHLTEEEFRLVLAGNFERLTGL